MIQNIFGKRVLKTITSQSLKLLINRRLSLTSTVMAKTVPDRWLNYSKIGEVVEGTAFIPFKVPLHNRICENLPKSTRHTTRDIIEAVPNVGLVINLTNTQTDSKYYNPNDWQSSGIDYKWIKVEGHVTPSQHLLVHFCHTVKQFMQANPSKLIGIHCTHGLNRTGYFVCSYMVLVLSIPPDEAMKRFSEARGYDIERKNYISSIRLHEVNAKLKQTVNTTLPVRVPGLSNKYQYSKSRNDYQTRNGHAYDYPSTSSSMSVNDPRTRHSSRKYSRWDDDGSRHMDNGYLLNSKHKWHKNDARPERVQDEARNQPSSNEVTKVKSNDRSYGATGNRFGNTRHSYKDNEDRLIVNELIFNNDKDKPRQDRVAAAGKSTNKHSASRMRLRSRHH